MPYSVLGTLWYVALTLNKMSIPIPYINAAVKAKLLLAFCNNKYKAGIAKIAGTTCVTKFPGSRMYLFLVIVFLVGYCTLFGYLIKYFVHLRYILVSVIYKKGKGGYNSCLVANACTQLIPNFATVRIYRS